MASQSNHAYHHQRVELGGEKGQLQRRHHHVAHRLTRALAAPLRVTLALRLARDRGETKRAKRGS